MTPKEYNARQGVLLTPDGLPVWSGVEDITRDIASVEELQEGLGLHPDGKVGPRTVAALGHQDFLFQSELMPGHGLLVFGPRAYVVPHPVQSYVDGAVEGLPSSPRLEPVTQGVIHYSVTRDNAQMERVLRRRGLSVHFGIEWDGSIRQWLDPVTRYAYHVGRTNARRASGARISGNPHTVGVELASWALPSKNDDHLRRWGAPRPYVQDFEVHGRPLHFAGEELPGVLGYSPEEEEALRVVCRLCSEVFGIPWRWPDDPYTSIEDPVGYEGWVGHCSVRQEKSDLAPLDFDRVLGGRR